MNELSSLMKESSLDSMIRNYHLSNDTIVQLKENSCLSDNDILATNDASTKVASLIQASTSSPNSNEVDPESNKEHESGEGKPDVASKSITQPVTLTTKSTSCWIFYAEDMQRISCIQIFLKPKFSKKLDLQDFELTLSPLPSNINHNLIFLMSKINPSWNLKILVPAKILSDSWRCTVVDENESLLLRLPYSATYPTENRTSPFPFLQPENANSLVCKMCSSRVLSARQPNEYKKLSNQNYDNTVLIEKVLPLPSNYWEDLSEFIMCYSGQPNIDFGSGSTTVHEKILYEAETIILVHQNDVGNSVADLAIPGYGQSFHSLSSEKAFSLPFGETQSYSGSSTESSMETNRNLSAEIRGHRFWGDAVSGVTLTCSLCCSTLGYASVESPDAYQLLKHRLILQPPDSQDGDRTHPPAMSVAGFVAHEMIRYAESRAIFSFKVAMENPTPQHGFNERKVLILNLLSWDTVATNSERCHMDSDINVLSNWNRIAKIVYEEVTEPVELANDGKSGQSWTWEYADWCCPDNTKEKPDTMLKRVETISYVWIYLDGSEWNELLEELETSSQYFSKDVAVATISAKVAKSDSFVKLSSVMLQFLT